MTFPALPTIQPADLSGFGGRPRNRGHLHEARVASALQLVADVKKGRTAWHWLAEAIRPTHNNVMQILDGNYPGILRLNEAEMTVSDFPLLTGDILDRMMIARFNAFPSDWRMFTKISQGLRDFRQVRRIASDGLNGVWDSIPDGGEHKHGALSETDYPYTPKLYGRGAKVSFQMVMNDDLGAFDEIPGRLGEGGARTIAKFVTQLWIDTNGPHASFFTGGNSNIITGNPALSIAALGTAFSQLAGFTETVNGNSEPIMVDSAVLAVCPALRVTANNIINQITVDVNESGGSSNQRVRVNNWLVDNLVVAVDPYIPIVAATANGSTTWGLFTSPASSRPALEVGQVAGIGEPVLLQKASDAMRIGGGVDQSLGSFSTLSQEYKGIMAFGGATQSPKGAVASNGSG